MRNKFFFIFLVLLTSVLQAQMTGNPIGTRGKGEWTISAIGTYMNQNLGMKKTISRRFLLKSAWGLKPWFDLYVLGGGFRLELKTRKEGVDDYKGKYQFGYGAGFTIALKNASRSRFGMWIGAHALRFLSQGSFMEYFQIGEEEDEDFYREFGMKYDWREVQGSVGIVFPYRFLRFYAAGVVWAVQRIDTKREYLEYRNTRNFLGEAQGKYQSGIWTGGIFGVEFLLPRRYSISIESLLFNEENFQIMVGICQTGGSEW